MLFKNEDNHSEYQLSTLVSVQKCHNAPICVLFAKPANLIFKFLSLKISLIQADCHWKQVLVVRSTRFHGFEQSREILPERDSDLLASLDKGIVHCRSQCTLNSILGMLLEPRIELLVWNTLVNTKGIN